MALPHFQATGNLVADPELKFTQAGAPVVNFRIACSERRKNDAGEWEDGATTFIQVTAWRQLAENIAESVSKGTTVTVLGKLKSRTVEDEQGGKTTYFEVEAHDVSVSLARAVAKITKTTSNTTATASTSDSDPWAAPVENPPF